MLRKELIKRSPIRILEKTTHGGLGAGNLGVFAARKGVGKTACMVHLATDCMLNDKRVIHISFAEEPSHIKRWYKQVFDEVARSYQLENPLDNFDQMIRNRLILHFRQAELEQVKFNIEQFVTTTDFRPHLFIVDGFSFYKAKEEDFVFWKEFAAAYDAEIWFSATLHRHALDLDEKGIPAPVHHFAAYLSLIIMLNPTANYVDLQLLKDHDNQDVGKLMLKLDPKTLLIANHRV